MLLGSRCLTPCVRKDWRLTEVEICKMKIIRIYISIKDSVDCRHIAFLLGVSKCCTSITSLPKVEDMDVKYMNGLDNLLRSGELLRTKNIRSYAML